MGKNDKKEKKGKKKKKESKTSKREDKINFPEALLAYQIQIKESAIEELMSELKQVEEKNARYKERNERLKDEQAGHVRNLLSEAKAQERELAKKEVVNREQVDVEIKGKWDYIREKERLFEELRSQINHLEEQTAENQLERDYWLEYKNVGSKEHAREISRLEEELKNIKQTFLEVNEYFSKSLEATKTEINRETEKLIDERKEMATEDAVKHMDLESQREIRENNWLKKEVAKYKKDVNDLEEAVQKLQQENLEIISNLYEGRLRDLNISRNVFWTQASSSDIPEDGFFKEDILKLEDNTAPIDLKPQSDDLGKVEKKFSSVDSLSGDYDSPIPPELRRLLHEDENDFQEFLQLGPVELKCLSVVGQAMPIHLQDFPMKNGEQEDGAGSQRRGFCGWSGNASSYGVAIVF
ncbi:coiled-coil domain-containing protein 83 [Pelodytes ibericus]